MLTLLADPETLPWLERLGSLGILGWVIVWAARRLVERLDRNTDAIGASATRNTEAIAALTAVVSTLVSEVRELRHSKDHPS